MSSQPINVGSSGWKIPEEAAQKFEEISKGIAGGRTYTVSKFDDLEKIIASADAIFKKASGGPETEHVRKVMIHLFTNVSKKSVSGQKLFFNKPTSAPSGSEDQKMLEHTRSEVEKLIVRNSRDKKGIATDEELQAAMREIDKSVDEYTIKWSPLEENIKKLASLKVQIKSIIAERKELRNVFDKQLSDLRKIADKSSLSPEEVAAFKEKYQALGVLYHDHVGMFAIDSKEMDKWNAILKDYLQK